MPELPEVETVRLGISPFALNQIISKIIVRNYQMRWEIPKLLASTAQGQIITAIRRRGKYLLFSTNIGTIIIHLGMSGVLRIVDITTQVKKHDHFDIILSNQKIIRLNDPRRFGCVLWETNDPLQHRLLKNLAPEPLGKKFHTDYLKNALKFKKVVIKKAIMDNKIVVGVGNIYASEILFEAKINPLKIAANLDFNELNTIVKMIKNILQQSIKQGGTTLKDFTQVDGRPGYFAQSLKVYGHFGQACIVCGNIIEKILINNRSTYFCPYCQPII